MMCHVYKSRALPILLVYFDTSTIKRIITMTMVYHNSKATNRYLSLYGNFMQTKMQKCTALQVQSLLFTEVYVSEVDIHSRSRHAVFS